jgi:hypothetical protein
MSNTKGQSLPVGNRARRARAVTVADELRRPVQPSLFATPTIEDQIRTACRLAVLAQIERASVVERVSSEPTPHRRPRTDRTHTLDTADGR